MTRVVLYILNKKPFSVPKRDGGNILEETLKLKSGATIPMLKSTDPLFRKYLTRTTLSKLHLMPGGDPVAFSCGEESDEVVFYFDPLFVKEAPPEIWYHDGKVETKTLTSGSVIERMSTRRAAENGFYSKDRLEAMFYRPIEEPVAYNIKQDGSTVWFYDKKTALRLPMMCTKCGKAVRFKHKLCEDCYKEDLAVRRAEGEIHRNAYYGMDPERILFFDLELTGFYARDEIISITVVNGAGELIMDTLVKPEHTKKWKKTEKIHGITPEMVENSPLLTDITPEIKRIFENADRIIAYGVSTDYSHIKYIYETEEEQEALHEKIRCCANEFVRYAHENRPDIDHASLIDAMKCFDIEWRGVPHSSIADTFACRDVWDRLFPNYYKTEEKA